MDPVLAPEISQEAPPARRSGYIARSWRGEVSLARAFFVNCIAFTLAFGLALLVPFAAAMIFFGGQVRSEIYLWLALLVAVFTLGAPLTVWQLVGLWRSANRHVRNGGRRIVAYGAYALVAGLTAYEVWDFPSTWQDFKKAQLLLTLEEEAHTNFSVSESDGVLSVSGLFGKEMVDKVAEELNRNPSIRVIHLTSVGGFIDAGQRLATLIKERKLVTYVSAYCKSSCTFAFLAGRERWLGPDGTLGFHSAIGLAGDEDAVRAMSELYAGLGVAAATIEKIKAVPPQSMWERSAGELMAEGLVGEVVMDLSARIAVHLSGSEVSKQNPS
jgi:hypothetical protein